MSCLISHFLLRPQNTNRKIELLKRSVWPCCTMVWFLCKRFGNYLRTIGLSAGPDCGIRNFFFLGKYRWNFFHLIDFPKVSEHNALLHITILRLRYRKIAFWTRSWIQLTFELYPQQLEKYFNLSLIHIWRCRRLLTCRSRWSPYH